MRNRRGGKPGDGPPKRKERKERPPPPLSAEFLHDQARIHLQRYVATEQQLRRVLRRRVERCLRFHGGEREAGHALVEQVLTQLRERGAVNDERVTRGWLDTLQRRGISRRAIRAKLREKGVDGQLIDRLLAEHDQALTELEGVDPEEERARAYAKRRRLGPWQHDAVRRQERRQKDLGAMARAGFSYHLAAQVIDGQGPDWD